MKFSELSLQRFESDTSHGQTGVHRTRSHGGDHTNGAALEPWMRAVWCVVLHGRLLSRQQADHARITRVLDVLEQLSRGAHSREGRRTALETLRGVARLEGGLMATALDVIESHELVRDAA